jgi:lysine decarboxylase/arginine decarboxylase
MANPGETILMPRNVHISVIKTCAMQNILPIFFDLEFSSETGHYKPITKHWLENVFKKLDFNQNKIVGVILVSPSYHGYSGDLEPLIDLCHQKNLPVLVDEAHGSYFLFCENLDLPKSALSSDADLVVQSLHKSLNGLTQTAVLWYKGDLVNEHNLIKSINLLQTTSPSSLLLSSCEESIKDWLNKKSLSIYQERILEAKSIYKNLMQKNIPLIETQDPLKIVVNTSKAGIDGFKADKFFYKNGLIAELPEMMTLTFCLGFANQKEFPNLFLKLWDKLLLNSKKLKSLEVLQSPFKLVQGPEIEIGIAWRSKARCIPFSQSLNKICGDIICPYPPGIPLLVPGEKIDIDRFNWINDLSLCNKDLVNINIRVI